MAIIIEGPDNSGKSTLVDYLSDKLKMPSFHAGGPPATNALALQLCQEQVELNKHQVILDRVTPISRQVYENRFKDPELMDYLSLLVQHDTSIIIYCRPPNEVLMDMSNHVVREEESVEHIAYVMENQHNLIDLYDRLMAEIPHVHYDWTGNMDMDLLVRNLYKSQVWPGYRKQLTPRLWLNK